MILLFYQINFVDSSLKFSPLGYHPPSILVGVETDIGDSYAVHTHPPQTSEFTQWTIAAARGHPILLDTLRRIVEMALAPNDTTNNDSADYVMSPVELTGPGPFTDSVLRYVQSQWGKTWADLRRLGSDGWRYMGENGGPWGDVKALSITGFNAGYPSVNFLSHETLLL
ncbi:hypothetical protein T439DRAFT_367035 [Meredithblackwellia eburnea MCA 4105]